MGTISDQPKNDSPAPTVAVIVPVHRGGERFARCIAALQSHGGAAAEVVVVSDASPDGSADLARRACFRVVALDSRSGPAVARNAGAREATSDLLLFVDADVEILPDTIERARALCRDHPGCAGGMGVYDENPPERNLLSQYKNLLQRFVHLRGSEDAGTFWGACGVVRRDAFLAVGGFDEAYREPSIEDIELGGRLVAAGHRLRLAKDLQVRHLKRWTAASLLRSDFFGRALPWSLLILRRECFRNDLNIDRAARAKVLLVGVALAATLSLQPLGIALAACCVAATAVLDRELIAYFVRQRGMAFAVGAMGWHFFSYLYSGVAFALALAIEARGSVLRRTDPPAKVPG